MILSNGLNRFNPPPTEEDSGIILLSIIVVTSSNHRNKCTLLSHRGSCGARPAWLCYCQLSVLECSPQPAFWCQMEKDGLEI
ncbi:unnamed protein product [Caretta caretta]